MVVNASATAACGQCECALCSVCTKASNTWDTPLGQRLESLTTSTEPRFNFAFNPFDADMHRMRKMHVLEPVLTFAWHEQTAACCKKPGALVVDVGGNFGWYTLFSVALGCEVAVFEPVPTYQEVISLGLTLNPGFRERVTLYGNVVYDQPGNYTLRVPTPSARRSRQHLGMTSMSGSAGILKAEWTSASYNHVASSVRIDDLVDRDVCMLKADVEGYEPQVMQTAQKLLRSGRVAAVQLEMTRTPKSRNQTCAAIHMLEELDALGYEFRQVTTKEADRGEGRLPEYGSWATSPKVWDTLPAFPPQTPRLTARRRTSKMERAYRSDFTTFSTNLIGILRPEKKADHAPPWPPLTC